MPNDAGYLITPAERTTLLEGPLGAVLMLGADKTAGRLSVLEHPLAPRALGCRSTPTATKMSTPSY